MSVITIHCISCQYSYVSTIFYSYWSTILGDQVPHRGSACAPAAGEHAVHPLRCHRAHPGRLLRRLDCGSQWWLQRRAPAGSCSGDVCHFRCAGLCTLPANHSTEQYIRSRGLPLGGALLRRRHAARLLRHRGLDHPACLPTDLLGAGPDGVQHVWIFHVTAALRASHAGMHY